MASIPSTQAPIPEEAAFSFFSSLAAQQAPQLPVHPPLHIFREDIVKCLEKSRARALDISELAAVHRCFCLDGPALISWQEFETSSLKMEEMVKTVYQFTIGGGQRPFTNSRARLLAARKKGLVPGTTTRSTTISSTTISSTTAIPVTSSQEIGWGHSAATVAGLTQHSFMPLKGSDVTKGGQGTNLASYFGEALARNF